jgi:hypothetical protein
MTALLALCAMMVVFSTIVTIMQEAMHKGFQSRRKGMNRLMESLYIRSIAPRLRNQNLLIAREDSDKDAARRFALDMTANDTLLQSGVWRKISELPVLRLYFGGRFERMSTNEFAEQLARSQVGQIIGKQDDAALKETIRGFAYDFERFGDAQTASFKKKAKVSAVLIGAAVAVALNVDVLHAFQSLMANQNAAVRIANSLTSPQVAQVLRTAPPQAVAEAPAAEAAAGPEDKQEATADAARQSLAESGQAAQAVGNQFVTLHNAAAAYEDFGLPIGSRFFPFCQKDPGTQVVVDGRCRDGRADAGVGMLSLTGSGVNYDATQVGNLWARVRSGDGDGLLWLISIVFAGGAFGMGAPFWFNLFRKLGSTTAGGKVVSLAGLDTTAEAGTAAFQPLTIRSDAATPDILLHAFRTVQDGGL